MDARQLFFKFILLSLVVTSSLTLAFNLTIMHTNDIHARVEEMNKYNSRCSKADVDKGKCYGGLARLKTKVDELRLKYPNSLLLDGGDQYQGTLFFYVFGGQIMSHFMNLLKYDAMTLGNHEFDNGPDGLTPFLSNVTFPVVCCNIDTSKAPQLAGVKKSTILKVGGHKIGIIGYLTKDTPMLSNTSNVKFLDEIESIQSTADGLKAQGINKIIAIGHAGYAKDKEIAHKVKGVDIIVGGHTNTFLYTGTPPANEKPEGKYPTIVTNPDGEEVLVVQDFAYGKYLGFLQVIFSDEGKVTSYKGNPILMDKNVKKDSEVLQVIESYRPGVEKLMSEPAGYSLVDLIGDRGVCRAQECNMGNLMTDAMVRNSLENNNSPGWNFVSIALINGGGIRGSISKGDITTSDWLTVMPFRNTVDRIQLKGEVILQALEHSASRWVSEGDLFGGFLQMSGLRVEYNMRRDVGSRVVKVQALCNECRVPKFEPLDLNKVYNVLISSFTAGGGDGYSMIKEKMISQTSGKVFNEELLKYAIENSPLTAGLDGRIRIIEDSNRDCPSGSTAITSPFYLTIYLLAIYFELCVMNIV